MTSTDQKQISELRAHLDRMLVWAAGAFLTVAIAFVGWGFEQEKRIASVTEIAEENRQFRDRVRADLGAIRSQATAANRETGELHTLIMGQKETLDEIRSEMRLLREYLQGGRP